MRIAIVGSGIAGLGATWALARRHQVTLYEADPRLGGHTNTVDMPWAGGVQPVDTGFIVYNERNYPNLTKLFATLGVTTHPSDMSFGVSLDQGAFEYAGDDFFKLFAQPLNALRPGFQRMLLDILRFNRDALRFLETAAGDHETLGEFLARGRYGEGLKCRYLLPMGAAIWSASLDGIEAYPARSFLQFYANHGLLGLRDRPAWRTVTGGARSYVAKMLYGLGDRVRPGTPVAAITRRGEQVEVRDAHGRVDSFDHVVLACHADQALGLIDSPTPHETAVLGAFRYQPNRAVLHRDATLMPKRRRVWSSWNYLAAQREGGEVAVSVTYWMNRLQGIDPACPTFVSLNPLRAPAAETVVAAFDYDHPQYDRAALAAQKRLGEIQGHHRLWFAGANWGWGFHEDGLKSGLAVASELGAPAPWWPSRPIEVRPPASAPTMPLPAAAGPAA
jgi:hypothetical protein